MAKTKSMYILGMYIHVVRDIHVYSFFLESHLCKYIIAYSIKSLGKINHVAISSLVPIFFLFFSSVSLS